MENNMKNDNIVVIGSTNTDMTIKSQHLPLPGETVLGGKFMMDPGGKGANQAVAAARLGGKVSFIGKVGDDMFGAQTLRQFKEEHINAEYLGVCQGVPSGVALINVDEKGENSISVAPGANFCLLSTDIDDASSKIDEAGIVLMQLEVPLDTIDYASQKAKEAGAYVILNPAPAPKEPLPDSLLSSLDLIIPNETEANIITGLPTDTDDQVKEAILAIVAKGVKSVIVTMGSRGAMAYQDGEFFSVPAFKVKALDTTGAGDTFCGALCVALAEGKSLREAIEFGCKASSIAVTRMGAMQAAPYRQELTS